MHIINLTLHNIRGLMYTTEASIPCTTGNVHLLVDICLQMNRHRLLPRSEIAEAQLRRDAWPYDSSAIVPSLLGPKVLHSSELVRLV